MEDRSRGSYILVKTTSFRASTITFEDEQGDKPAARVILQDGHQLISESYGIARSIIIKELLCKEVKDGSRVIAVLHLADIVVLALDDHMLLAT